MEPLAIALGLLLAAAAAVIGFVIGRHTHTNAREPDPVALRRLETYDFYPVVLHSVEA